MEELFQQVTTASGNAVAAIFAYVADRALFLQEPTPKGRARSRHQRQLLLRHLQKLEAALEAEQQRDQTDLQSLEVGF
jgi:hypothetical protein